MEEDLKELRQLLEISKRSKVQTLLKNEICKLENKITVTKVEEKPKVLHKSISKTTAKRRIRYEPIYSYYFVEDEKYMKIFTTVDKLTNVKSAIGELDYPSKNSFNFRVSLPDINKHFQLRLVNLHGNIDPKYSSFRLKKKKAIIILKKQKSEKWHDLFRKEQKKEPEPSLDKDDPNAGIMNLMQKMYSDGDDDMKRMIKKTWYESRNKSKEDLMNDKPNFGDKKNSEFKFDDKLDKKDEDDDDELPGLDDIEK